MRRSRHLDDRIERLTTGDPHPGDPAAVFIDRLRSGDASTSTAPTLVTVLAQEAERVASDPPDGHARKRSAHPLARKWRRRAMISTFVSTVLGKLAIGTVALAATTGALAATDNLPDPAQEWVSDAVSHVGIDIPSPDDVVLPEQTDNADPANLDTPEDAADTARNVVETIESGDPTTDGRGFGESIADTATADNADVADGYTDGAGSQADEGADNADVADGYTDGAGSQADEGADNADVVDGYTDGAGSQADEGVDNADVVDGYTDGAGSQADEGVDNADEYTDGARSDVPRP